MSLLTSHLVQDRVTHSLLHTPSFWEFSCLCLLPHCGVTEVAHTPLHLTFCGSRDLNTEPQACVERAFYPRHHLFNPKPHILEALPHIFLFASWAGHPPPHRQAPVGRDPNDLLSAEGYLQGLGRSAQLALGLPEWPFLHPACPPSCRWLFPVFLSEQKFTRVEEEQGLPPQPQHSAYNRCLASLNSVPSRPNGCPWHRRIFSQDHDISEGVFQSLSC